MDINKSTFVFYSMSIYPKDRWVLYLTQEHWRKDSSNHPFHTYLFIIYDNTKDVFIVRGKLVSNSIIYSKIIDYKPFSFVFNYTNLIEWLKIVFDTTMDFTYNTYNFQHLPDDLTTVTYKYCAENMSSDTMVQPYSFDNNYEGILWWIKSLTDLVNENESV